MDGNDKVVQGPYGEWKPSREKHSKSVGNKRFTWESCGSSVENLVENKQVYLEPYQEPSEKPGEIGCEPAPAQSFYG